MFVISDKFHQFEYHVWWKIISIVVLNFWIHIVHWCNDWCHFKWVDCWFHWSKKVRLEDTLSRLLIFGYLLLHELFLTNWFLCGWNQAMRKSSMVYIAGWITIYLSFVCYVHFSVIILIYLCILFCMFNPLVVSI